MRAEDLATSAIAPGERVLFAEFGTLASYDSLDESQPMTRAFELAPVPEYALLSFNALIVATEQRLLVGSAGDDGSAQAHLAVSYPQIKAVARPDTGLSARRRYRLSRFLKGGPLGGVGLPDIADVNPPFEIRGENEAVVLLLRPSYAKDLLAVLREHADVPVLPIAG
jgi:hypothetical protein